MRRKVELYDKRDQKKIREGGGWWWTCEVGGDHGVSTWKAIQMDWR